MGHSAKILILCVNERKKPSWEQHSNITFLDNESGWESSKKAADVHNRIKNISQMNFF